MLGLPADGHRMATELFDAAAKVAERLIGRFKPRELSNTCWAFAKANHRASSLFDAVADTAAALLACGTVPADPPTEANSLFPSASGAEAGATAAATSPPTALHHPPVLGGVGATATVPAPALLPAIGGAGCCLSFACTIASEGSSEGSAVADGRWLDGVGQQSGNPYALGDNPWSNPYAELAEPTGEEEEEEEGEIGEDGTPKKAGGQPGASASGLDDLGDFEQLACFTPMESTNLLYSFARAAHFAPGLYAAVAAPVAKAWQAGGVGACAGWSAQDVCNTLWSLAAADALHLGLIEACVHCLRTRPYVMDRPHLTQLQQWALWWEVEMGRDASWMSATLREKCRQALASGDLYVYGGHTTSAFQRQVGACLMRLRVPFTEEFTLEEGYSLDIAIVDRKIAIEVDGPFHFTQERTLSGATVLKQRQLTSLGWTPLSVPHFEWYPLHRDPKAEEAYMRKMLTDAGVKVDPAAGTSSMAASGYLLTGAAMGAAAAVPSIPPPMEPTVKLTHPALLAMAAQAGAARLGAMQGSMQGAPSALHGGLSEYPGCASPAQSALASALAAAQGHGAFAHQPQPSSLLSSFGQGFGSSFGQPLAGTAPSSIAAPPPEGSSVAGPAVHNPNLDPRLRGPR